jgi:hypothetical protein
MRLNSPGSCHDSHLGRGEGNVGREILVLNEDPVTALRSGDDHTDCPSPPQEGGVAASTGQGLINPDPPSTGGDSASGLFTVTLLVKVRAAADVNP